MFSFKRIPLACIGFLLIFGKLAPCHADGYGSDLTSLAKAIPILMQLKGKWTTVHTLKYDIEVRDTESEGFRQSINETGHDRDLLITHLTFMMKGADFGWKSDTFVPGTGEHERVSTGARSDGVLSILYQGQQSLLMVAKNAAYQSDIPVTGCNPLMEAFSFLVSDDWNGFNCPAVQLSSLLSPDTWTDAAKRVTSITAEQIGDKACVKLVFGPLAGNHDVVYFSKDMGGFPLDWQHFEGTYMRREVSVLGSDTKDISSGKSITLPLKIRRRDFYDPAHSDVFCTSEQTLSGLEINQTVNDDDLIIDPSLADAIFDRDNEKRILIPK